MEFRRVAICELLGADYNPRVVLEPGMPGYERLKRSIDEFGLVQPIVWNERTGRVVGGHQRLSVLKHEGHESVDVVVVSLDDAREKALNVALNNDRVGGDWDAAKLSELLDDLSALPDFDETLTGFDEADFKDLLLAPDPHWQPEEAAEAGDGLVRVTLEVDAEQWDQVRSDVDHLIKRWGLRSHISGNAKASMRSTKPAPKRKTG